MREVNSFGGSTCLILVILTVLALVELSQGCHRRVEYHHYYKKRPHKGHGHGHGGGGGYGHMGGHGHGGGGHSKGHGHGGGHHGGGHGHSKGYGGHGGGGHGHGGGHHGGGYGHMGGHGQKGYGGHDHKGYGDDGHGGGGHHGGGHKGHMGGYGDTGYGHDQGHGYGHEKGHGHGGGGYGHQTHGHGGHGGDHGKGYGGGHGGGGHDAGYEDDAYGHEHDTGHGHGHGHGKGHGKKGHKVKYHSYESTHYNDKDGHSSGYSHSSPHYMKQGYGHSGPYPNTEYSTPVEASVQPPDEIESGANQNSFDVVGITPHLDAADTASLVRNSYDPKENDIMSHNRNHDFGMLTGSSSSISTTGRGAGISGMVSDLHGSSGSGMIPTPTMQLSAGSSPENVGLPESKVDPGLGNFDLNLSYNSDLPDPFQREFTEVKNGSPGIVQRKRKKISSKYRSRPSSTSSLNMDSGESQQHHSQIGFPQSDPMNDATESKKSPEFVDFMNF